jgi:hypothetical protein
MATAAAAGPRALRDRVTFDPNAPQTVTLESAGVEQPGRDGTPEFRYMLEGQRIMWVAEEAHRAIERAMQTDPQSNCFSITKRKSGRGAATWEVIQHADEPAAYTPPASQPRPAAAPPAAQPARAADLQTQQRQLPAQGEPYSTTLYSCLCAAIRDAQEAERFSQQIGRAVAFETGDIRAMAATLFIHATR